MHRNPKFGWFLAVGALTAPAWAQEPAAPAAPAGEPAASSAPAPAVVPAAAAAEHNEKSGEEPFGKAGVINIGSDLSLNFQHTGYSAPSGGESPASTTSYMFGPAADYFVINNLSVGAAFVVGRSNLTLGATEAKADVLSVEPRVGYHIALVPERLGLWPKLSFFYDQTKYSFSGGLADSKEHSLGIIAFVPLLIHPVEHFHFGIGPYFQTALSAKAEDVDAAKATTIGLRLEIAGWWKL